ncbi:rodlin [Streptomyces sp. NPDC006879]|uniref:rodlin n=1 Tax=Streptomyces sp. NPDC006879 TaxID=3364767 RepID=UPI0036A33F88
MLKKIMATAAVTATVLGAGAAQALATGNDGGVTTFNGNGSTQAYGNSKTHGDMSPQLGLVQGTLNKPCIGVPAKVNAQSILALVNVGVQDIPILSAPQTQQCTENSTQAKGDEPLSHILDNIFVASANGAANN